MKKGLLITLLLLLTLPCLSQGFILTGTVIDSKSKEKLPYANIALSNRMEGTYSDETGTFQIQLFKADTLVVYAMGYKKAVIPVSDIADPRHFVVALQEEHYELSEVVVKTKRNKGKYVHKELGYHDARKRVSTSTRSPGLRFATYIENEEAGDGMVNEILLKVRSGKPNKIRLSVYQANRSGVGGPQKDLLRESVIVTLNRHWGILHVDLSQYNIPFPKDGLFVGVEFLGNIDESGNLQPREGDKELYSQVFFSKGGDRSHTWTSFRNKTWSLYKPAADNRSDMMIGLEVAFYE